MKYAVVLLLLAVPLYATTLQQRIDQAAEHDVLLVQPGVYEGNIVLNKSLTLKGIGRPVLRGSGKGSVITVSADGCAIEGFIVEHSGGDLQQEDSGILLTSNHNRIENNELSDILYGIYMLHSAGNTIRRNTITGRPELEDGERGAGLHLWNSPDNTLDENVITWARDGLYIQSSSGNKIRGNRVSHLRYGVHYMFSDSNTFEDNLFEDNVAGAAIMYSRNICFRRNAFLHNRGFSSFGILFQACVDCSAEENYIVDNATGIFMESLANSVIRKNVIAENDVALQIFSSSDNNLFVDNNFVQNISPLQLIGKRTTTQWNHNGRGNYWSDYDGYDLDADGVGDVPHKVQNVFEYMEGNFPRLRIYLYSPAAQALAAAEKTFPIIESSQERDSFPLIRPVSLGNEPAIQTHRGRSWNLAAVSLLLFGSALLALWKGQRS